MKLIKYTIAGAALFVMFWALRVKYPLLGDNVARVKDTVIGSDLSYGFGLYHLAYLLMSWVHPAISGETALALTHAALGVAYVFICYGIAQQGLPGLAVREGFFRVAIFAGLVTCGGIQIFFGYIEGYGFAMAAMALYFYLCLRFFNGEAHVLFPVGAFVVMALMHKLCIIFLPSLAYLIYKGYEDTEAAQGLKYPVLACITLLGGYVYLTTPRLSLSLIAASTAPYAVFSWAHVSEFANGMFLATPLFPLLLPAMYLIALNRGRIDFRVKFMGVAAAFALLFVMLANFNLGACDWDLMSFAGLPVAMFVLMTGSTNFRDIPYTTIQYVLTVFLLISGINTFSYIWVNASESSADRFTDIVLTDPANYFTAPGRSAENYAAVVIDGKVPGDRALELHKQDLAKHPDHPRAWFNVGMQYLEIQEDSTAAYLFRESYKRFYAYSPPFVALAKMAFMQRDTAAFLEYSERIREVCILDQYFVPLRVIGLDNAAAQCMYQAYQIYMAQGEPETAILYAQWLFQRGYVR